MAGRQATGTRPLCAPSSIDRQSSIPHLLDILHIDSSAFAKRLVEEKGSQQVQELCSQAAELCLRVLCVPEVVSALNRRLRENT